MDEYFIGYPIVVVSLHLPLQYSVLQEATSKLCLLRTTSCTILLVPIPNIVDPAARFSKMRNQLTCFFRQRRSTITTSTQKTAQFLTPGVLLGHPVLVFCLDAVPLYSVHKTHGDQEVMSVSRQSLARAVNAACCRL